MITDGVFRSEGTMGEKSRYMWQRLRWMWFDSSYQFSELMSAMVGASLGLWIILPYGFFYVNQNYSFAATLAPHWVWGIVFLAIGASEAAAVFMGWLSLHRKTSVALFFLWAVWSIGILISNYQSPGWFVYLAWGIISLRASVKAERVDLLHASKP